MPKVKDKSIELEVLIATMNKTSLDFLSKMFGELNYLDFNILVVNQTSKGNELESPYTNIKVVNSYEKGLSKSRNIAINHATKPVCLLADDDIVFKRGFDKFVLQSHKEVPHSIITFQTQTTLNKLYWEYPKQPKIHNEFIRRKTLSIEISFKKEELKGLQFNEGFGLGAQFEDGENYIFLNEANKRGIEAYFVNKTLSVHEPLSSSDEVQSDRLLYAKSAIHYYKYGKLAYFWVYKFVFFLFRKKFISFGEIIKKINLGFSGIRDYKKINS